MKYDSSTLRWVVDKVKSLEAVSGVASVNPATGTGNAITDIIKEGSGLTPNKGLTFSLSGHTHPFSSIANIPTTIGGYGITDAYTKTQTDALLALKLDAATFNDLFEKVNVGTESSPIYAIKAKYDFYSIGEVSAFGAGSGGSSGGGLIQTVYDYSSLGSSFNNATLTDTFNAYTINQLHTRLSQVEVGAAVNVAVSGTGNAITGVTKNGNVLEFTKGLTFSLDGHTHDYIPLSQKGIANGVASLDANGLIISAQLPSYVDDVIEVSSYANLPVSGESGKIYVITGDNITYRWTGTTYVEISKSIALGETSSTAYRGDLGAIAYAHSQIAGGTGVHVSGTERTNWNLAYTNNHTHTNKSVLDGITSTLISNWNTAYTNNHTHANKSLLDAFSQSDNDVLNHLSIVDGKLKVDIDLYSLGEVSAFGAGSGSSGSGLIQTVYGYSGLGGTYSDSTLTDTFNAYTINKINNDLGARITSLEAGSALNFTTTGSGNAVTSVAKSGNGVTVTKGLTFSVDGHTHLFSSLTNIPTTLAGYGITDALLASAYTAADVLTKIKTVDGAGSELDADTLDGVHNGNVTAKYFSTQASSLDANNPLSPYMWFYGQPEGNPLNWADGGIGAIFTTLNENLTLNAQFNWFINHNSENPTRSLFFRASNNLGFKNDWKQIAFTTSNVASATKLSTDRTNWADNGVINNVVGQLAWKNWGNGHTIFDASNGYTPTGVVCSNTDADIPWQLTNPTLMGYNGNLTFGVRVDSSRTADKLRTGRYLFGQYFDGTSDVNGDCIINHSAADAGIRIQNNSDTYSRIRFNDTSGNFATIHAFSGGGYLYNGEKSINIDVAAVTFGAWSSPTLYIKGISKSVGINTTNPAYNLDVNGSFNVNGISRIMLSNTPTPDGIIVSKILGFQENPYGLFTRIYQDGRVGLQAQRESNDAEVWTLSLNESGGNVLIGTGTNSGYKLDVNGTLRATGAVTANRFYAGYDSGVANSISCSGWFRSNGTSGWINDTYGGGINMSDTTYVRVYNSKSFWVDNNIVATGEITAFGASDIRLKSNIKQIDSALDFLGKVKTYEFDWNEKAISLNPLKTKKGAGVIAQEMSLLDNNFVHSIYGDYLGVDYERFIPYLIRGVNEVGDEVTILKKRVAELELEIKQLKK